MNKKNTVKHCVLWVAAALLVFAFVDTGHTSTVVRVDFNAENLFAPYNSGETPPESSLVGSLLFEHSQDLNYAGSVTPTLTSIDLEIAGHAYSLGEVGLGSVELSNGEVSQFTIGGLLNEIGGVSSTTNDFEVITSYGGGLPDRMWYATDATNALFKSETVSFSSQVVPIPPSVFLLAPGFIGVVWHHRRRRRRLVR